MSVYYISPSTAPARTANSIHVFNMCEAMDFLGYKVTLFIHSKSFNQEINQNIILDFYGIRPDSGIKVSIYRSRSLKGVELNIAIRSVFRFLWDCSRGNPPHTIVSRNIYAAVMYAFIFRRKVTYEVHSPESGFRKSLQKCLLLSPKVQTVVISKALRKIICDTYGISTKRIHVFPDAAKSGLCLVDKSERSKIQTNHLGAMLNLFSYDKVVGYFGHLYSGRGIDVIEGLASKNPNHIFLVYGGNEEEISYFQKHNLNNNLFFMGYVFPVKVHELMSMMDVLLMPYQTTVSIGIEGVDTSQWMSPMKMFEYMSCGVPIISSNLPVLREVLVDGHNSLLVEPDVIDDWSDALQRISGTTDLEERLGVNAYKDYKEKYTWNIRAKGILELFNDF
jgi:glycosyltransferase involved in cell wall biosynthesis